MESSEEDAEKDRKEKELHSVLFLKRKSEGGRYAAVKIIILNASE